MLEFSSEPNSVTGRGHTLPGRMRQALCSASVACRIRYRRIVLKQLRSVTIFREHDSEQEQRNGLSVSESRDPNVPISPTPRLP